MFLLIGCRAIRRFFQNHNILLNYGSAFEFFIHDFPEALNRIFIRVLWLFNFNDLVLTITWDFFNHIILEGISFQLDNNRIRILVDVDHFLSGLIPRFALVNLIQAYGEYLKWHCVLSGFLDEKILAISLN